VRSGKREPARLREFESTSFKFESTLVIREGDVSHRKNKGSDSDQRLNWRSPTKLLLSSAVRFYLEAGIAVNNGMTCQCEKVSRSEDGVAMRGLALQIMTAILAVLPLSSIKDRARTERPELVEPPSVTSQHGVLNLDLIAGPGTIQLAGKTYPGQFYNEAYLPPLLRVRSGDTLNVRLINHLKQMTNLHLHGMNISPQGNGDNVFLHVQPGSSYKYKFTIPVSIEQHPGLFWYHPHAHGLTNEQIIGGMSGGIVVEGASKFYPFLKDMHERVLLLKHIPQTDHSEVVSVNGQIDPAIVIRPGEVQFWRIGNIGADLFYKLHIPGMTMYLLATDGHWLSHPTKTDAVFLGPGSRAEAVVVGGAPGEHPLVSEPFEQDKNEAPNPQRRLATVVVRGVPTGAAAEAETAAQKVNVSRWIEAVRTIRIAKRRTVTFSRNPQKTQFYINGRMFDENRTDTTVKLGDTEEWTILNEDNQLHNFHIHQTDFLVTEINGVPQHEDSLHDTFTLPAGDPGKPSEVKVIIPFIDPTIIGRFVFHCHIVKHEDKGMMATIEVLDKNH
jgi:suppressor of ftsI